MDVDLQISGFKASAIAAGLKKDGELDMALFFSETPAVAAGVFTTNRVKAAPVIFSTENVKKGTARAIIANSGNANACTGERGVRDTRHTAELVARGLGIGSDEVLVSSTGVIGLPLDMGKVESAIPKLIGRLSENGFSDAARAIMTTDTFAKIHMAMGKARGVEYQIMGIAKGAGMIMPNMATMLCFIFTNINVEHQVLAKALSLATRETFNKITVDGDTSTNDMVLALANGTAGNAPLSGSQNQEFTELLKEVMGKLAKDIVRDGEGATKLVEICIKGAVTMEDAAMAARAVANSLLVKTAIYGKDPNWGRIMAAIGRSGAEIEETRVDIWVDDTQIVKAGLGTGIEQEQKAQKIMEHDSFSIIVDLNLGSFQESILTCDISHEYVSINAEYRT